MNCAETRTLLHAYADGELDVAHSLALEEHLNGCAACADAHGSVSLLKTVLQRADLRCRAPNSLRKEVKRMNAASRDNMQPRFNALLLWKLLTFSAATAALLALILRPAGSSERDQFLNEAVSSHVRSLMVEHLTDVASSDQHTVKPWFNGKLDFAPNIKDFATDGFPLVGGRLDYLNGRAVAALVYRRNRHFINVFVWPATNGESGKIKTENHRGYSVINREAGGLHYCLVSDLNEKELSELAGLFGR